MTNEEAIKVIKELNYRCGICGLSKSVVCNDAKDIAIQALEENTKLKAEIEQLKEEVNAHKLWSDVVERTLKKEIDKNAKLCEEIAELKRFRQYFDELYGTGLEVANWHLNGDLESLDNFMDSANDYMKEKESN